MEKSGVVGIMAEAHQKSRTMAAPCGSRGQTDRGYHANLVPSLYILQSSAKLQTPERLCKRALKVVLCIDSEYVADVVNGVYVLAVLSWYSLCFANTEGLFPAPW